MNFEIKNTTESDLGFICWLFDEAIVYQKKNKYPVWKGYDKTVLEKDIEDRRQYKLEHNGEIACIFSVLYSDEMLWTDREKGDAIYLHRVVVNPKFKGNKLFEKIVDWAISHAKECNREFLRMDTWANNATIIDYYQNYGFKFLDEITTSDDRNLPLQNRNLTVALLERRV